MTFKIPYYFSQWEPLKQGFPFNIQIHTISPFYESHRHAFVEFFYVFEGKGYQIINGVSHNIQKGTFCLILPYQVHELHSEAGEIIKLYNCSVPLDIFFGSDNVGSDINNILFKNDTLLPSYVNFTDEEAEKIYDIFCQMKFEFDFTPEWSNMMFKAKIAEALILFDRKRRCSSSEIAQKAGKYQKISIWDIVYYIHKNYHEDINLNDLSKKFYMNPSYISYIFKKSFGKSFKCFLNEVRILHASSLLATSDMPVTQIAYEAGFKSYSSFCRVFSTCKGISAKDFRKKYRY